MACPCCNPCACASRCSAPPSKSETVDLVSCGDGNGVWNNRVLIRYLNKMAGERINPFFDTFVRNDYFNAQDCIAPTVYEFQTLGHQCWTSTTRPELPSFSKGKTRYKFRAFALRCNGPSGGSFIDVTSDYLTGPLEYDKRPTDNPLEYPTEVFASEFPYPDFYPDPVPNCLP